MPTYANLHERLHNNSQKVNDCRFWTGYCQNSYSEKPGTPGAYSRINLQRNGRSLKFPVHRAAKVLEEIVIFIPDFDFYNPNHKQIFFDLYQAYSTCGLSIDHLCKKSLCINPEHLEWVHLTKNQQRKKWSEKKRLSRMEKQAQQKTRHYHSLIVSTNVFVWIKKIQSKQHRIK